jgi:hypothetical protein
LAHDLYILPPKTFESLSSHFAEGRREIDQVNAREELGDIDEFGHCFDVPACATTNLHAKSC